MAHDAESNSRSKELSGRNRYELIAFWGLCMCSVCIARQILMPPGNRHDFHSVFASTEYNEIVCASLRSATTLLYNGRRCDIRRYLGVYSAERAGRRVPGLGTLASVVSERSESTVLHNLLSYKDTEYGVEGVELRD